MWRYMVILHVALQMVFCVYSQGQQVSLNVLIKAQEMDNWCWAATAQMTMEFEDRHNQLDVSQCRQALLNPRVVVGAGESCCGQSNSNCDQTGWPMFSSFQFTALQSSSPLTWDQIKREIDGHRPIVTAFRWDGGGGGHMVIIRGYSTNTTDQQLLHVIDPQPISNPSSVVPRLRRGGDEFLILYDEYVNCQNPGRFGKAWDTFSHWRTYYEIQRSP